MNQDQLQSLKQQKPVVQRPITSPGQQPPVIVPPGEELALQDDVHELQTLLAGVTTALGNLTEKLIINPDAQAAKEELEQRIQDNGE